MKKARYCQRWRWGGSLFSGCQHSSRFKETSCLKRIKSDQDTPPTCSSDLCAHTIHLLNDSLPQIQRERPAAWSMAQKDQAVRGRAGAKGRAMWWLCGAGGRAVQGVVTIPQPLGAWPRESSCELGKGAWLQSTGLGAEL